MSVTTTLSDNVARHLNDLPFGQVNSINDKLALLLEAEYRRRLARYSLTDRQLAQKYQMRFEEFEQQRVTEQRGYTWEVESDAMAWETAVDGLRTVRQQLSDLRGQDLDVTRDPTPTWDTCGILWDTRGIMLKKGRLSHAGEGRKEAGRQGFLLAVCLFR